MHPDPELSNPRVVRQCLGGSEEILQTIPANLTFSAIIVSSIAY